MTQQNDPTRARAPASPSTGVHEQPVEVGRVLKGQYLLEELIGEGGMGKVFRARDLDAEEISRVHQYVAVKVLKPEFREHPDALRALYEEVRKSLDLVHENIVGVYPCQRDGPTVFVPMEYLEGKALNVLLDEEFARGMPFEHAWPVLNGAGKALAHAHDRGIVHSDVKPSNIFVTTSGRAKVLDFGIARAARTGTHRRSHYDPGDLKALTLAYASPEMIAEQPPDQRDDVYGFACVCYEVLTGRHPFGRKSAEEAAQLDLVPEPDENLSRRQHRALVNALKFSRERRTGRIEQLLAELKHARSSRMPVGRAAVLAAVGAVIIGTIAAIWWMQRPDEADALFNSLYQPTAAASDADPETVQLLLEQARGYLTEAQQKYDPALLSKGVSSAYGGFAAVLRLDPGNREAAQGVTDVFRQYREHAHEFEDEGDYRHAVEAATYGLEIYPNSADLKALKSSLAEKLQPTS